MCGCNLIICNFTSIKKDKNGGQKERRLYDSCRILDSSEKLTQVLNALLLGSLQRSGPIGAEVTKIIVFYDHLLPMVLWLMSAVLVCLDHSKHGHFQFKIVIEN